MEMTIAKQESNYISYQTILCSQHLIFTLNKKALEVHWPPRGVLHNRQFTCRLTLKCCWLSTFLTSVGLRESVGPKGGHGDLCDVLRCLRGTKNPDEPKQVTSIS